MNSIADNFMFFYLILAIILLAISLLVYSTSEHGTSKKK